MMRHLQSSENRQGEGYVRAPGDGGLSEEVTTQQLWRRCREMARQRAAQEKALGQEKTPD